ncbi:hypothetical protein ACFL6I_09415 [candidate division KSB1 bacterium]
MTRLFDSLSGDIDRKQSLLRDEDIALINNLPNPPPVPVTKDTIYVRKCRLAGDGVNCHFGRFRTEDLKILLEKVQGVSCLIGHRKDTAGIARFFGGGIERHTARDLVTGQEIEMNYIAPKIYWMKNHSMAEDLRLNIDGGIYHQASISWYFEKPVCQLCGKDIRACDHVPGKRYDGKLCFFWYEGITDVLEGSIVFAGGHPGTGFELCNLSDDEYREQGSVFKIGRGDRIEKDDILPYLQTVGGGALYVIGDIADRGWTESTIDILPEPYLYEKIGDLLPTYLMSKLVLHDDFTLPGGCIKVKHDGILELDSLPDPEKRERSASEKLVAISDAHSNEDNERKVYTLSELGDLSARYIVMPYYDGAPVHIACDESREKSGADRCTLNIPPHYEHLFTPGLLLNEVGEWNIGNFELTGTLLAFRGRNRIDPGKALYGGRSLNGRERFVLKVTDFNHRSLKKTSTLKERLSCFSDLVRDSGTVARIPIWSVSDSSSLLHAVQSLSTRLGVYILENSSTFADVRRRFLLMKCHALDVVVLDAVKKQSGWVYNAGIERNGTLDPIGATHITNMEFASGDIIRVLVEDLFYCDGKWGWRNPRVLNKRFCRTRPDPESVLERLACRLYGNSGPLPVEGLANQERQSGDGERQAHIPGFRLEKCGKDREDMVRLTLEDSQIHENIYFCEEDLKGIANGLCAPGRVMNDDPVGRESVQQDILRDSEIDSGPCTLYRKVKHRILGAFAGSVLNGVYMFRQVGIKDKRYWYILKK